MVPWAFRNQLDARQTFLGEGTGDRLKTYLRVANQEEAVQDSEFADYGFSISPSGSGIDQSGISDIEIKPTPDVEAISMRDVGLNQLRLQFGAHSFLISHSWVKDRMERLGMTDPYQVFRATNVIGLIYLNRIFSIENVIPNSVADEVVSWSVIGNVHERAPVL